MIFDVLIQLAVMGRHPETVRLLIDLRNIACGLDGSWITCQVFMVG